MNSKIFILSCILIISLVKTDDKCRVLILEGGGDRGAYQAGAFHQFVQKLSPEEVAYDVIVGTSAGGLNAGAISFFEKGDEKSASSYLTNIWQTITQGNVWQFWSIFDDVIFKKQGLLNTAPLKSYLTDLVSTQTMKRNFSITTTDLNTGLLLRLKNEDVPTREDQVNMMLSTSAIPIVFPHVTWRNSTFVDGGTVKNLDISGGVKWCREHGFENNQIIVDAMLCIGTHLDDKVDHTKASTIQVLIRTFDIIVFHLLQGEILTVRDDFPLVNLRYLVIPPILLDLDLFLLFIPEQLEAMYNSGVSDAQKAIDQGEGVSWDEFINQFKGKTTAQTIQQVEKAKLKLQIYQEMFLGQKLQ